MEGKIISYLSRQKRWTSGLDIAREMKDVNASNVYRSLKSLRKFKFVETKMGEATKFHKSVRFYKLKR